MEFAPQNIVVRKFYVLQNSVIEKGAFTGQQLFVCDTQTDISIQKIFRFKVP